MEFEDILKDVGDFGFYQKLLLIMFVLPCYIVIPWYSMDLVFMTSTPEHWCFVPEVDNSNLSLEMQKNLIRPPQDESCSMYDVNYTEIMLTENFTVDPLWPTTRCTQGWKFDTKDYDATAVTSWNLVCRNAYLSSLVLSMVFVGTVFGTPIYGWMLDKIGRKPSFFFLSTLVAVAEISSVFSPFFVLFLLLRAIQGSVMSSVYSSGYVILLELVSPKLRSWINGLVTTAWSIGLCLLPLVAYLTRDWVRHSMVTASCAAAIWIYWKLLPESPRWLILAGRYDEANAILCKISKYNGKSAHISDKMKQKIEMLGEKFKMQEYNEKKHSPFVFFKYPTLRKRFLLVTACWVGISITYYGLQVNVKNLFGNQFLNFFLLSLMEIPSHIITWFFLERIGRRCCSVIAFSLCTISCLIPVIIPSDHQMVAVVASILAKAAISSAFMTLYQQSPEIFPTSLRCMGIAMSSSIGLGSTLLMPYIVYLGDFGIFIPFLIFAIISCISGICSSFLPETLNKNLPQTVEDAENFETNFSYLSCFRNKESTTDDEKAIKKDINKNIRALSAADLQFSLKEYYAKGVGILFLAADHINQNVRIKKTVPFFPALSSSMSSFMAMAYDTYDAKS